MPGDTAVTVMSNDNNCRDREIVKNEIIIENLVISDIITIWVLSDK